MKLFDFSYFFVANKLLQTLFFIKMYLSGETVAVQFAILDILIYIHER
jgi:hypothetical protein